MFKDEITSLNETSNLPIFIVDVDDILIDEKGKFINDKAMIEKLREMIQKGTLLITSDRKLTPELISSSLRKLGIELRRDSVFIPSSKLNVKNIDSKNIIFISSNLDKIKLAQTLSFKTIQADSAIMCEKSIAEFSYILQQLSAATQDSLVISITNYPEYIEDLLEKAKQDATEGKFNDAQTKIGTIIDEIKANQNSYLPDKAILENLHFQFNVAETQLQHLRLFISEPTMKLLNDEFQNIKLKVGKLIEQQEQFVLISNRTIQVILKNIAALQNELSKCIPNHFQCRYNEIIVQFSKQFLFPETKIASTSLFSFNFFRKKEQIVSVIPNYKQLSIELNEMTEGILVEYQNIVRAFLYDEKLELFSDLRKEEECLKKICSLLLDNWDINSMKIKGEVILAIDAAIQQGKQERNSELKEKINTRIMTLKRALTGDEHGWKAKLLGIHLTTISKLHFSEIQFDPNAQSPLISQFKTRINPVKSSQSNGYGIFGTSFTTNRAHIIKQQAGTGHVLDGFYSAKVNNIDGNGYVIALGDGCGGHFGEPGQDKAIANAAYFASKCMSRLMATYSDPELLKNDIPLLLKLTAAEIKNKNLKHPEEGTTLVAGRLFPLPNGKWNLIGVGIGDSMMAIWDGKEIITLISAKDAFYEKQKQEATAIFPIAYKPHEVQIVDKELPEQCIIVVFSDGVHDHLPCTKDLESDQKITLLNSFKLSPILSKCALNIELLTATLVEEVFKNAEKDRLNQLQKIAAEMEKEREKIIAEMKGKMEGAETQKEKVAIQKYYQTVLDSSPKNLHLPFQLGDDISACALGVGE